MMTGTKNRLPLLLCVPVLLAGCVAAVPAQPPLVVLPGQNKTAAEFQRDDAACQAGGAPAPLARPTPQTGSATAPQLPPPADGADTGAGYYQCMASRGNSVLPGPRAYPYPYPYAAYAYGGYPYYGPGYGYPGFYGYPYSPAFLGVYGIGLGVGFGYGGFYGPRYGFYGYRNFGGYRGYGGGPGGFRGGGRR